MSVRTLNGLGNTNIYVNNMFANGEAIEITQTSNTTQAQVNVSMKQGTTESTAPTETDIIITSDGSTGKIVKYASLVNLL